ncbi:hypothetical protein L596_017725 [Steinernema carpocapsae]|uniref:NTR domain-containing protein n=1 Tax=Steinernema carpocapsae TaxID=34508 RepID=A0A4U5N2R6_STECR|nr:hypothetical protein L596_017725 [Steinernema carpocapsae]
MKIVTRTAKSILLYSASTHVSSSLKVASNSLQPPIKMIRVLALVLVFCRCPLRVPKEVYCDSAWVGVFNITTKESSFGNEIAYGYQTLEIYRQVYSVHTGNFLYTSNSASACGIDNLQIGEIYLLAGKVGSGMTMNTCGQFAWDLEWSKIPADIKHDLHRKAYNPC